MAANSLENRVNGRKEGFLAKLGYGSVMAGATYAAYKAFGLLDGAFPTLAFPLGRGLEDTITKKGTTMKNMAEESIIGLGYTPALYATVKAIEHAPEALGITGSLGQALTVGALTLPAIPLLNAVYYGLDHLVKKRTFKGMGQYFKDNYWEGTKKSLKYIGLIDAATFALSVGVPTMTPDLIPIFAGLEVAYRMALGPAAKKIGEGYKKFVSYFRPNRYGMNPYTAAKPAH